MPGYGYAKTSKSQRSGFAKIITDYVFGCEKMYFLFVLVDSRLEPQRIDLEFIHLLGEHSIPFGLIFTKGDKLSKAQLQKSVENYSRTLSEEWDELPPMFVSSSRTSAGRDEILEFVDKILK